jgi:predicted cupin superfamily sugar epimerase
MNPRAAELIRHLELSPHPEGGYYRETWRSTTRVSVDQRPQRSALTTIYFLLVAGSFSAWHRVRSDEVWHWHEGEPLELLLASPDLNIVQRRRLGPVGPDIEPVITVPADWWQAARPCGGYALCGCTVGPGFEFEDFTFLRNHATAISGLHETAPDLVSLL